MACRPAAGEHCTVQGHQLAHTGGAAWLLPLSNWERQWTPRGATLFYLPVCRSSAQVSLGSRIILFWVGSSWCSVESPLSRWPGTAGADMDKDYLTLKRASASRLSGRWNDDDFDVLAGDKVVG